MIVEMNRRRFLHVAAGATAASLAATQGCAPKKKPNILWLISEDISPDIGCYGNDLVKSPNIDGLAAQGIRFDNAFASCPVCSPSRSAFMTGMYQTFIGAHNHRTFAKKPLPEPVQVITHYFRKAGYFVSNGAGLNIERPGKTDWNFEPGEEAFDGTDWSQRANGQPFFHQINFRLTHRVFERDPDNPIHPDDVELPPYYPDHPITRRDWADYLESLQVLDKEVGSVLKRLEDEGLSDSTIIFYFGDHGRPHVRGKQWLYQGGIRVPLIVRFPDGRRAGTTSDALVSLIDLAPTAMKLADIDPPSHLQGRDFLGFWSRKRKEIFAARDRCDGTVDRIRCVRTKRYKLIQNFYPERPYSQFNGYKKHQYPIVTLMKALHEKGELTPAQELYWAATRPKYELYDIQADPYEITNVADDPDFADVKKKLIAKLDQWLVEYDQNIYPEDPERMQEQEQLMQENYIKRMTSRGLDPEISDQDYLKWWETHLQSTQADSLKHVANASN